MDRTPESQRLSSLTPCSGSWRSRTHQVRPREASLQGHGPVGPGQPCLRRQSGFGELFTYEEIVVDRELGFVTITVEKCKERTQLGWALGWTQEPPRKERQKISDTASFPVVLHLFPHLAVWCRTVHLLPSACFLTCSRRCPLRHNEAGKVCDGPQCTRGILFQASSHPAFFGNSILYPFSPVPSWSQHSGAGG